MAKSDPDSPLNQGRVEDQIEQSLLRARRIFLSDAVDGQSAQEIIRKIWYLELREAGKPILLVINSPGGSIDAGFAIWDQIKMVTSPITTLVTGLAASMGSILSLSAAPKKRLATPNARIMIHQPSIRGVIQGQASDLDIQAKEILKTKSQLVDLYVKATGKTSEVIQRALDRDSWKSAQEALEFGLLDRIVHTFADIDMSGK